MALDIITNTHRHSAILVLCDGLILALGRPNPVTKPYHLGGR